MFFSGNEFPRSLTICDVTEFTCFARVTFYLCSGISFPFRWNQTFHCVVFAIGVYFSFSALMLIDDMFESQNKFSQFCSNRLASTENRRVVLPEHVSFEFHCDKIGENCSRSQMQTRFYICVYFGTFIQSNPA